MNEDQAKALAEIVGGEPWMSGGDIWLIVIRRADGRIIGINDECVVEYLGEDIDDPDVKVIRSIEFFRENPLSSEFDENGHMYILGLPVEPDMPTIADLLAEEAEDI